MKKLIIAALILTLGACKQDRPKNQVTYIIVDQTDRNHLVKDIDFNWLQGVGIPSDMYEGSKVILKSISDKMHTPEHNVVLNPVVDQLEYNEFERKKELLTFSEALGSDIFTHISRLAIGSEQSLVFFTITSALNDALSSNAQNIDLYVFSDLQNKSKEYNCYNPDDFGLLKYDQDSLTQLLDQYFPIQTSNSILAQSTIKMHLLYEPQNTSDDFAFDRMAQFLKGYYTAKGIQVNIGSSISSKAKRSKL